LNFVYPKRINNSQIEGERIGRDLEREGVMVDDDCDHDDDDGDEIWCYARPVFVLCHVCIWVCVREKYIYTPTHIYIYIYIIIYINCREGEKKHTWRRIENCKTVMVMK